MVKKLYLFIRSPYCRFSVCGATVVVSTTRNYRVGFWPALAIDSIAPVGDDWWVYLPPLVRRWSESVLNSVLTVPAITGRILI